MKTVLTLDLGTSYFKSALVDADGRLCALDRTPAPITRTAGGLCEMSPDQFRETVTQAVRRLADTAPGGISEVAAVTFSTQTNSFLLLDEGNRPLTPFVIWADERAMSMTDRVQELSRAAGFQETTGVVQLDCQYVPAKLLWLQSRRPDVWREARRFCLISDYLTLWFTGRHVTESGAAGLLGLVDVHRLQWWDWACEQTHLPQSWLPHIVRAGTDLGSITPDVADTFGLPRTCRFVVGCLDQYAGAMGAGNIVPGMVSETTGTVLATARCSQGFDAAAAPHLFQGPAFDDGVFFQMLFGSTSANLLEWYRSHLSERPSFEALCNLAANIQPGAEGLRLGPDPTRGTPEEAFIGRGDQHATGHAVRSIMETVAFALADQMDRLCGSERPVEVRSCGGAARSETWLQIKADVTGVPFVRTEFPSPACLGSAMLAARALGWGELDGLARAWVRTIPPRVPDPRNHEFYLAQRETMRG